jgi:hypothetical protein
MLPVIMGLLFPQYGMLAGMKAEGVGTHKPRPTGGVYEDFVKFFLSFSNYPLLSY